VCAKKGRSLRVAAGGGRRGGIISGGERAASVRERPAAARRGKGLRALHRMGPGKQDSSQKVARPGGKANPFSQKKKPGSWRGGRGVCLQEVFSERVEEG